MASPVENVKGVSLCPVSSLENQAFDTGVGNRAYNLTMTSEEYLFVSFFEHLSSTEQLVGYMNFLNPSGRMTEIPFYQFMIVFRILVLQKHVC